MEINHFTFTARKRLMTPRLVIFHSHSGSGLETAAGVRSYVERQYASGDTGVTQPNEHLDIDGKRTQMLPWDRAGVHSFLANGFAIGVETADHADVNSEPWMPGQIASIAEIMAEAHRQYGIPIALATAWDGTGMGYHAMWGSNTLFQPRKNKWTKFRGKTCPGTARVAQFPEALEMARQLVAPPPVWQPPKLPLNREQYVSFITMSKPSIGVWASGLFVVYAQQVLRVAAGQSNVPLHGNFDAETYSGVVNLQAISGLTVDGFIGPETWGKIDGLAYGSAPTIPE